MKTAFVIGHHYLSQGAYSPYLKMSEWSYHFEVAKHLPTKDIFFHNPNIPQYWRRMKAISKKLDDYDLVVKMHFNAFNGSASGCEALYFHNNKYGRAIAEDYIQQINNEYGSQQRKPKGVEKGDRGYYAIKYPLPTTIIIEPFFGDNPESLRFENSKRYAELLINIFEPYI